MGRFGMRQKHRESDWLSQVDAADRSGVKPVNALDMPWLTCSRLRGRTSSTAGKREDRGIPETVLHNGSGISTDAAFKGVSAACCRGSWRQGSRAERAWAASRRAGSLSRVCWRTTTLPCDRRAGFDPGQREPAQVSAPARAGRRKLAGDCRGRLSGSEHFVASRIDGDAEALDDASAADPAQAAPAAGTTAPKAMPAEAGKTELPSMFKELDQNKDGQVSKEESKRSAEVQTSFDSIDSDRNGKISVAEWNMAEKAKQPMKQ